MSDGLKELDKAMKWLVCIVFVLSSPLYIDFFTRSDHIVTSEITSIYEREHHHKSRMTRYRVASTKADGRIDLEIPIDKKVGDSVTYAKNYGIIGITFTSYTCL